MLPCAFFRALIMSMSIPGGYQPMVGVGYRANSLWAAGGHPLAFFAPASFCKSRRQASDPVQPLGRLGFGRNDSAERTNVSESLLTCGKAFTAETAYRISRKSFSQSTILLTYRGPLRFGLPAPSWRTSEPKALEPAHNQYVGPWD